MIQPPDRASVNPFRDKPPAKKRIITVSVTKEQDDMFEEMKIRTGDTTDGALIKRALAYYLESLESGA